MYQRCRYRSTKIFYFSKF